MAFRTTILKALLAIWTLCFFLFSETPGLAGLDICLGLQVNQLNAWRIRETPDLVRPVKQLSPEQLLSAALNLRTTKDLELVSPNALENLRLFSNVRDFESLLSPALLDAQIRRLIEKIPADRLEKIFGRHVGQLSEILQAIQENPSLSDFNNGFGSRLLSDKDPAFTNSDYLSNLMRSGGSSSVGYGNNDPAGAANLFKGAWKEVAPENVEPIAFTQTGSDANNLFYSIARKAYQNRTGKKVDAAEILYLDGSYGGGRGPIARINKYIDDLVGGAAEYRVPSPHSKYSGNLPSKELARVRKLEKEALDFIEQSILDPDKLVGGLLMEPILGPSGVYFYRPEFLRKLRRLCDKYKIPLLMDEILTGGGRTGKFFAYQHFGVEPDFVTFGKGLLISGLAHVYRDASFVDSILYDQAGVAETFGFVTVDQDAVATLKAAAVLERIKQGHLIENASVMGAYLLQGMNTIEQKEFGEPTTRGMGLLLATDKLAFDIDVAAGGRIMPFLTITKDQIDFVLSQRNNPLP